MFLFGIDGIPTWVKLICDIVILIASWLGGHATGFRRGKNR